MVKKKSPKSKPAAVPKPVSQPPKVTSSHLANLAAAIAGKGKEHLISAIPLADDRIVGKIKAWVSTGSIAVDKTTRIGGFPYGRVVEILGLPGTGKSTLVMQTIARVQAAGGVAALLDSENKLDPVYAKCLGVDTEALLMIQPDRKSLESAIVATERAVSHWIEQGMVAKGVPLAVIWDSFAQLPPEEELENPGSKQPGVAAKLMKQALRTLVDKISRAQALFLVTNQMYEKIGGFSRTPGVKRSSSGGEALRYVSTMRLELVRIGTLEGPGGFPIGLIVQAKMLKNHAGSVQGAAPDSLDALEVLEEQLAVARGLGTVNAWSVYERLKAAKYITMGGHTSKFQATGLEPVTWTHGWRGLDAVMASNAPIRKRMLEIYMGLR